MSEGQPATYQFPLIGVGLLLGDLEGGVDLVEHEGQVELVVDVGRHVEGLLLQIGRGLQELRHLPVLVPRDLAQQRSRVFQTPSEHGRLVLEHAG